MSDVQTLSEAECFLVSDVWSLLVGSGYEAYQNVRTEIIHSAHLIQPVHSERNHTVLKRQSWAANIGF